MKYALGRNRHSDVRRNESAYVIQLHYEMGMDDVVWIQLYYFKIMRLGT